MGMCCEKMMMIGWRNAWSMGVNVSSGTGLPWVVPDKRPLNDCCCCTQISRKLRNCTTTVTSIYKLCSTGTLPARSALWWCDKLNYYCFFFSVVCPMRQCCSVDDTSQEHTVVSLSPGWVDPDVDWLYISINIPHPAGTRPSTRSPPMTGWSEWHPNDPMVILFRIHGYHMPKESWHLQGRNRPLDTCLQ